MIQINNMYSEPLPTTTASNKMETYNTQFQNADDFHDFLERITQDKHKAENILKECNNCQCCADHQQNRPTEYAPWVEVPQTERPFGAHQLSRACECRCRHVARWICRCHPSQYTQTDPQPSQTKEP